ncbi:thermonuclease family protein [Novispirillum sp. DQ9]|uniref:thermonuclease family protein n=1 Tax=Novispirillum sp. DQ9 TaxID=3398612 RepID=UPI003C7CE2B6
MGRKYRAVFAIVLLLGLAAAPATAVRAMPPEVARGRVVAAEEGGVLRLDDGRRVRLALLEDGPALRAATAPLAEGAEVALHWPEHRRDRHGRLVAHVVRADGLWVQEALVGAGAARVMTFADERAEAAALLAAEDAARRAGRGLWADPATAPLAAADVAAVAAARGRPVLVEGVVAGAAVVRGRLYLNFGADWRSDVTVSIAATALKTFPAAARAPEHWRGARVRARGWVRSYNGPLLEIDHPEALERLSGN